MALNNELIRQAIADNMPLLLEAIELITDRAMNLHGFEFVTLDEDSGVGDFVDKAAHQAAYNQVGSVLSAFLPKLGTIAAVHNTPFYLQAISHDFEAKLLEDNQE